MKAVVYTEYGTPEVLQFREIEKPVPQNGEVLIKVHAVSLNMADWYSLLGKPYLVRLFTGGLRKPKNTVLGADVAGTVVAVGKSVTQFRAGDEVFGDLSSGGLAEYVAAPETRLVMKPSNLSFEEAAAVPLAGVTALQGLRNKVQIRPGQKMLINGASGGVGIYTLQIAKAFGAEVTAVCSTRNIEMAHSLGADHVIDYKQQDFTKNGQRYDVIIAANGNHSIFTYQQALNSNGTYLCLGGSMSQIFSAMLLGPLLGRFSGKTLGSVAAAANQDDLLYLKGLVESGKVKPVLDRCFPLSETADAFRYFGEGRATGKVIISVS